MLLHFYFYSFLCFNFISSVFTTIFYFLLLPHFIFYLSDDHVLNAHLSLLVRVLANLEYQDLSGLSGSYVLFQRRSVEVLDVFPVAVDRFFGIIHFYKVEGFILSIWMFSVDCTWPSISIWGFGPGLYRVL